MSFDMTNTSKILFFMWYSFISYDHGCYVMACFFSLSQCCFDLTNSTHILLLALFSPVSLLLFDTLKFKDLRLEFVCNWWLTAVVSRFGLCWGVGQKPGEGEGQQSHMKVKWLSWGAPTKVSNQGATSNKRGSLGDIPKKRGRRVRITQNPGS